MTLTLEELEKQQQNDRRMTALLRENLYRQQQILAALCESVRLLGQRISQLERAVMLTSPGPVWVDRLGHD